MIEIHASAFDREIVIYHEFLLRYSKDAKVVYGFMEGKEDPCFYRGFIESLLPEDWSVELWPAGNKKQVYAIHKVINWRRFRKSRVCFFVDRDLSDMIPETLVQDKNIYVTTGYSIENDVVNKGTCHRILSELCGFSNVDHDALEAVCELFDQELETFLQSMVPIMAWILAWRRNDKRPNLNDILMRDLFSIVNGRLQSKATPKGKVTLIEYLHDRCKIVNDHKVNIVPIQNEFCRNEAYKKLTRGKYVFWFLVEFCNAVHRDSVALFKEMSSPPKMHSSLSFSNGIGLIGPRSRIPKSLREFLQLTFCAYITSIQKRKIK